MPKKETVEALTASGLPYSPVVRIGDHFHFSGVIPQLDNGKLVSPGDISAQIKQVLGKIDGLLQYCGLSRNDVYSATVMLEGSMNEFPLVNKMYAEFFAEAKVMPRRKAFAVAALPFGALIEIEFDAVRQG